MEQAWIRFTEAKATTKSTERTVTIRSTVMQEKTSFTEVLEPILLTLVTDGTRSSEETAAI